jgi:hypothetical protein
MLVRSVQILLVVACCLALTSLPLYAQFGDIKKGVQKGAEGVKQGGEKAVDVTKEGAQKTKRAVTGEPQKSTDTTPTTERMKQTPSRTEEPSTSAPAKAKERTTLPRTAGEAPLLVLVGMLALAAAGASRAMRRAR